MPPLGPVRRPRQAAVEVGCTTLEMVPAHHGLRRRLGMRQQPAGGGTRSSPPAGWRQVRPDSSSGIEGLFGPDLGLWQRLQQDCGCCDILTYTELLRELHAGVVDDVV